MAKLKDIVTFDISRLFNGAIDVDWIATDADKAANAARAFVFHGPSYHGVSQHDVGAEGHTLIDSASFVAKTLNHLEHASGNPFSLAIAGFGSGKSHLAVTLSELLTTSDVSLRQTILKHLGEVAPELSSNIERQIKALHGRTLVLTLNGMNNADLASELLAKTKATLSAKKLPTAPLEELRQRFKHAAQIIQNIDVSLRTTLLKDAQADNVEEITQRLAAFDEAAYKKVHDFLEQIGIPLKVVGDETAKDVLSKVAEHYLGEGKAFDKMLILFDEFGHYMEYATSHPQIAGGGALQHLFEGIQSNDGKIVFVGFVQYELKVYEQRLSSPQYKNEIRRFISRFETAEKLFLSSNLETLVASLLVKSNSPEWAITDARRTFEQIKRWYPIASHYSVWNDEAMFSRVIAQGCWPLSPLAMWTLFHLSVSGQYLQQRSARSLLKAALDEHASQEFDAGYPTLPAVGLWTAELQREFENAEETLPQASIMQAYGAVLEKCAQHLSNDQVAVLRSVVLITQTHLKATSLSDAKDAIIAFSGLPKNRFEQALARLMDDLNVVAWDDAFKQFDILGDTASRAQLLRAIRLRENDYDDSRRAELFIKRAVSHAKLQMVECDFAMEHHIHTQEWKYAPRYTHWRLFQKTIANLVFELRQSHVLNAIDAHRGIVVYFYVSSTEDEETVRNEATTLLRTFARELPLILVLLFDDGTIGKALVELDILETFSTEERATYQRLIATHQCKQKERFAEAVTETLQRRAFLTAYPKELQGGRLAKLGADLFNTLFPAAIAFPFDGYTNSQTNAAKDCAFFIRKLLTSAVTFNDIQTMPVQQRNRANTVLNETWSVFARDGSVSLYRAEKTILKLTQVWDREVASENGLNCEKAIKLACMRPYGANIASACLLFAVYVQANLKTLTTVCDGLTTNFTQEIDHLFKGVLLDTSYLSHWNLHRVTTKESEWDRLLADWGNSVTYREIADLSDRAKNLKARLPIPVLLGPRVNQMLQAAKEAYACIEKEEEQEDDARAKIVNGTKSGDLNLLMWGASLMATLVQEMSQHAEVWGGDSGLRPLVDEVNEAKQRIVHHFEQWCNKQSPSPDHDAFYRFREQMRRVDHNLKILGLSPQRELLKRRNENVNKAFERITEATQRITSVEAWLSANATIPDDVTVVQLEALAKQIEEQKKLIAKSRDLMSRYEIQSLVSQLSEKETQLLALQDTVEERNNAIAQQGYDLWNVDLTVETVADILSEAKEVIRLYTGSSKNLEDFQIIQRVAESFQEAYRQFNTLQMPEVEYTILSRSAQEDFVNRFMDDEPPWNLEEAFNSMLTVCRLKRHTEANRWFAEIQKRCQNLQDLPIQEANKLLHDLSAPPGYVDETMFAKELTEVRFNIEHYLETKGIDWLYEKFLQLSPSAQHLFLERIKGKI